MEKQVIATSDSPRVTIKVAGSLHLKGTDELEVSVKAGSSNDLTLDAQEDAVQVHCKGDCWLQVPRLAAIESMEVRGDAHCKALEGPLTVEAVRGSLTLRDVASVRIDHVHGDLIARHVEGDLSIRAVDGNAVVKGVEGVLVVQDVVRGNVTFVDVEGNLSVSANGNASMRLDPMTGQKIECSVRGNIFCRLPEDASVDVRIEKASDIQIKLDEHRPSNGIRAPYQFTLGEGDAFLILSANGNVLLAPQPPDWEMFTGIGAKTAVDLESMGEDISRQVMQQVEAQVEMMENQLEAQLSNLSMAFGGAGLSEEAAERISKRAREASARATARAQEKMKRAQEKIQRRLEAAQRRAEQKARVAERRSQSREKRVWGFDASTSRPESEPRPTPVSEEERLLILKMLEEKKISVEEAEQLLAALEGNE